MYAIYFQMFRIRFRLCPKICAKLYHFSELSKCFVKSFLLLRMDFQSAPLIASFDETDRLRGLFCHHFHQIDSMFPMGGRKVALLRFGFLAVDDSTRHVENDDLLHALLRGDDGFIAGWVRIE